MKKIKKMIESAATKTHARDMINLWYSFGLISEAQLEKGRKLIKSEFT